MKRKILLLFFLTIVKVGFAIIAYPDYVNYCQPDGTTIKVRMMGDEFLHWAETEDGYTLLADAEGYLTLALRNGDGDLSASEYRMCQKEFCSHKLTSSSSSWFLLTP